MMPKLSFEDAVILLRQRGFAVEPGPSPGEVTLIAGDHAGKTYCVFEAKMLVSIAMEIITAHNQRAAVRH
jgi:hypothetical protein